MAKRIGFGIIVLLLLIQVVRPKPNVSSAPPGRNDFGVMYAPPPDVQEVLAHACYDCHSDTTRYPWYAHIEPVGWWLSSHVNDGKRHLNFSEFGAYSRQRQGKKLDSISDELTEHTMPLKSYLWIHTDARLTEQQIARVSAWMDELHDKIAPDTADDAPADHGDHAHRATK